MTDAGAHTLSFRRYCARVSAKEQAFNIRLTSVASQCESQCGVNTLCTGALDLTTAYICNCQIALASTTNNGRDCGSSCTHVTDCGTNAMCINSTACQCNTGYQSPTNTGSNCSAVQQTTARAVKTTGSTQMPSTSHSSI